METLIAPAVIIIASVISYWLITSSRFRKDMGKDLSSTIREHSKSMTESASSSRIKSKLEFIQELADDGYTQESVEKHLADFNSLIALNK